MGHDLGRYRSRQQAGDHPGDELSALPRLALFGTYLLHGIQGQFWRVQSYGARALRRTKISRFDLGQIHCELIEFIKEIHKGISCFDVSSNQ